MEIKITRFFNVAAPMNYSASVAEIGQDAGRATWASAVEDSADYNLLDTDEKREAFRSFVRESGGWSADEIAAWSNAELNALCIQWVSGDMREGDLRPGCDWNEYQAKCEAGQCAGRIFQSGNDIYFELG